MEHLPEQAVAQRALAKQVRDVEKVDPRIGCGARNCVVQGGIQLAIQPSLLCNAQPTNPRTGR